MRVIAGSAGGISLTIPKTDLRPTMEKVKGAIFSSLGDRVPGARVADLFAGTGSLGIEALSRGAVSAVFVESNAQAATTLATNLARTRLVGAIIRSDVFRFLAQPGTHGQFDLVFADPPYAGTDPDRASSSPHGASSTSPALRSYSGTEAVIKGSREPDRSGDSLPHGSPSGESLAKQRATSQNAQATAWRLLEDPHLPGLLDPGGLLVLEHPPRAALPENPQWIPLRTRAYGKTSVSFFAPSPR